MMHTTNPGSLQVRLGACLQQREECRMAGNLEGMSDAQDDIADYLSVHLDDKQWKQYAEMPGYSLGDDRSRAQVKADLGARLRFLFKCVKAHNVFARDTPEMGDGSVLDQEDPVTA